MKKVKINGIEYDFLESKKVSEMEPYKAYLYKDKVYLFLGDAPKKAPGIYKSESGKYSVKPYPAGKEVTLDDVYDGEDELEANDTLGGSIFDEILQDKEKIVKQAERPVLSIEEKGEIFAPPISDEDNILVRIVKTILKDRQINIKELLPRFKDQMEMNNFKRSLRIHGKMSIERFEKWMEVLEVEWDINYIDNSKTKKKK